MTIPRAALFDLDDTLAPSFQPPDTAMIDRLTRLIQKMPVAIISAAGFPRIERDILLKIGTPPSIKQFYIFPNSSAECYTWQGDAWRINYDFMLTPEEREHISSVLVESVAESGIIEPHPKYEPRIIDRGVQIAYAALGLEASEEDKSSWDPDQAKRKKLKTSIEKRLTGFEVLIGGKTTIDITRQGINKAYGVEWFVEHLNIPASEMLYVGDALYPGGNDAVVIPTGIQTKIVKGPDETAQIIDSLLSS